MRLGAIRSSSSRRWRADRLAKALPPRKLFRYVQIERKLDAVTAADTAQKIPLVP